jgi:ribosomal protein S18 acetylase RimI-like enzyme
MLRRATTEDVAAVASVFRRAYGTLAFLPTLHTPEEDRDHFADVVRRQEVWVSEVAGTVVGFAALEGRTLTNLYIEPTHQRRNLCAELLERVKDVRRDGFDLWVFQRNEGARRFYERHGCRLVRLTDGEHNEEREPDALYEWMP